MISVRVSVMVRVRLEAIKNETQIYSPKYCNTVDQIRRRLNTDKQINK